MNINAQLETILFVAGKPLSLKKIIKVLQIEEPVAQEALANLCLKYNNQESGIVVIQNNDEWQMVASPDNHEVAENFLKAEVSGEITRPELEQIRGVNCSLILRNLMMRGLVKEAEDPSGLLPKYEVTTDYLRHLGVTNLNELPEYEKLHNHEHINITLSQTSESAS